MEKMTEKTWSEERKEAWKEDHLCDKCKRDAFVYMPYKKEYLCFSCLMKLPKLNIGV